MSSIKKLSGAQIPVILTVVLVVGTAWSWISQQHRSDSPEDVQNRLASFALEGGLEGEEGSVPPCCMTLKQAKSAEADLVASKTSSCEGCPGSSTSKTADGKESPACCPGSASAKCESGGKTDCCSKSDPSVTESDSGKPACCPGSATSKTSVTDATSVGSETAAMIEMVKIPQVGESR